jgi:antitoxin PrlF
MHLHYHFLHHSSAENVMGTIFEAESTLTDRYQTTVPDSVRRALHLKKQDRIRYIVRANEVVLTRAPQEEENDPAIAAFLAFLEQDIRTQPQRLQGLDAGLVQHVQSLVADVDVDLDAPLSEDDE